MYGGSDFPVPGLVLIVDHKIGDFLLGQEVSELIDAGVTALQFRDKLLPPPESEIIARRLFEVINRRCLLIVHNSSNIALSIRASGVHLPSYGCSVPETRLALGDDFIIGCSVHSVLEAIHAAENGADYLQLGSIFTSKSHPGVEPIGLSVLREVTSRVDIPVLAVGGISPNNIREVMDAGASGVSVISSVLNAEYPSDVVRQMASEIKRGSGVI